MTAGRAARLLPLLPRVAAWIALATAGTVLVGWAGDVPTLQTILPGSVPMRANTALAFLLAGIALLRPGRPLGRAAAGALFLIGAATLTEYLLGWDLHIDQALVRDLGSGLGSPGRMALSSASAFVALGPALWLAETGLPRRRRLAEFLSALVALFAAFAIESYVVGTTQASSPAAMALPAALLFVALSVGTIASVPDSWLVARLASTGSDGILARRLLPSAIALPLVVGRVVKLVERAGWLDVRRDAPLEVVLTIAVLLAAGWWSVVVVQRVDRDRQAAEERFRFFFDESPVGMSLTAPDGRLLRVNRAFSDFLGYSRAELQELSWPDVTHADDLAQSRDAQVALISGTIDKWEMEKRYRTKDGRWVWAHVVIGVHRDAAGQNVYHLTHVQDIDARKRAEASQRALLLDLQQALAEVRVLKGILPICASCKRIRAEEGHWEAVESYVRDHTDAEFTHGLCPECAKSWAG